jgi:hypothetical protein
MPLTGDEHRTIAEAICTYLSPAELRRALKYYCDIDASDLSLANRAEEIAFDVVDYADRHGFVAKLATAMIRVNENADLRVVLDRWLGEQPALEQAPSALGLGGVPPWALTEDEKVTIVRRLSRRIAPAYITRDLPMIFAQRFDGPTSNDIVNHAIAIRQKADPQFPVASIAPVIRPVWEVGPLNFWSSVFGQSAGFGARMLAAVLLAAPGDTFDAYRATFEDVFRVLGGIPK